MSQGNIVCKVKMKAIEVELLLMNFIDKTQKDASFVNVFAYINKISEQWRFQENGV
jgi:hypothetical protein